MIKRLWWDFYWKDDNNALIVVETDHPDAKMVGPFFSVEDAESYIKSFQEGKISEKQIIEKAKLFN